MKKTILIVMAVLLCVSLAVPAYAGNGNNAPSGAHYNLNIIGVDNPKSANMDSSSGHVIFVPLRNGDVHTKILLQEGDYAVLDKNGTDGEAAFQLPNPDPNNDGITVYSVYARALGTPGGKATITPVVVVDGLPYYSLGQVVLERKHGKVANFENVSKDLLYIYADIDDDTVTERVPLFDDRGDSYFWDYNNEGLKVAQLRFYEVSTDTTLVE